MEILLHIGQSKTGTSAIQYYLTLNRIPLREAGILFPSVAIGGMPVDMGNHNSVADALAGVSRFPNLTAKQYFDQFFREAQRCGATRMILSAEHFFGGEPRIWDVPDEKTYFERYPKKIEALARSLDGHEVTLLVYLRPQIDWLASAISQTVRTELLISLDKKIYHDDRQFFYMAKPLLRYYRLIDAWVKHLSPQKVVVVPYERRLLYKNSVIADFLHRADMDDLDLPLGSENLQVNESLSREYIEVKKILNRRPKSKIEERVVIACLERLSARSNHTTSYTLSDELVHEVAEFVSLENEQLNKCYIRGGERLKAKCTTSNASDNEILSEENVANALAAFEKEFAKPRARLLTLDYTVRDFLRKHAKPVHGALHQLKRLYRSQIYRK